MDLELCFSMYIYLILTSDIFTLKVMFLFKDFSRPDLTLGIYVNLH